MSNIEADLLKTHQNAMATIAASLPSRVSIPEELIQVSQQILETFAQLAIAVAPIIKCFNEANEQFAPIAKELIQHFKEVPERNRRMLRVLGSHGWYFDPSMPASALGEISNSLENNSDEANEMLCEYFESHLTEIEYGLSSKMQKRAHLLRSAFAAHQRGEFELSIPIFLIQADGFCYDQTGRQLFSKKDGGLGPVILTNDDPMGDSMLTPLVEPMPISARTDKLAGLPTNLNRHAVLHGFSTDYGTKKNSCRCISLLVFISWVLERSKEHD
jgi:hypothetical protein